MRSLALILCALALWAKPVIAHEFTYDNAYLANLKLAPRASLDESAEYYLRYTDYPRYLSTHSNALEWPKQLQRSRDDLSRRVTAFNASEPFDIVMKTSLGGYDTATQSFELGFMPSTEFLPSNPPDPALAKLKLFTVLTNTVAFSAVKLPPEATRAVLKYPGHRVLVRIQVKLTQAFPSGKMKGQILRLGVLSEDGKTLYASIAAH